MFLRTALVRTMATSIGEYPMPEALGDRTLVCQWAGCVAKPFAKYFGLFRHLKSQHNVPGADLEGMWVGERKTMERRTMQLTDKELEHVRVVYDESGKAVEDVFECTKCAKVRGQKIYHHPSPDPHLIRDPLNAGGWEAGGWKLDRLVGGGGREWGLGVDFLVLEGPQKGFLREAHALHAPGHCGRGRADQVGHSQRWQIVQER